MAEQPLAHETAWLAPGAHGVSVITPWADLAADCCFVMARYSASKPLIDPSIPAPARAAPRRKAEFVAGQACAREALRLAGGPAVMPGRGDDHAPIWPPGMVGSISHSKGCAIAVAARQSRYLGLGIDIERLQTESSARKIAPQILGESELRQLPEAGRAFLVSLAFSAKESLFKALYPAVQQFQSFHAAAFSFDGDRQQACLELAVDWSAQWRRGQRFPIRFFCRDGFILTCTAIAAISCRSEMSG